MVQDKLCSKSREVSLLLIIEKFEMETVEVAVKNFFMRIGAGEKNKGTRGEEREGGLVRRGRKIVERVHSCGRDSLY